MQPWFWHAVSHSVKAPRHISFVERGADLQGGKAPKLGLLLSKVRPSCRAQASART